MTNTASFMPAEAETFQPIETTDEPMPAAAEIFRPATPVPWPTTRSVIDVAIELLPTLEDDLLADLVETLVLAIVDREEELRAVRAVFSAALALTFTQHNEIVRLQIRDAVRRRERAAAV